MSCIILDLFPRLAHAYVWQACVQQTGVATVNEWKKKDQNREYNPYEKISFMFTDHRVKMSWGVLEICRRRRVIRCDLLKF